PGPHLPAATRYCRRASPLQVSLGTGVRSRGAGSDIRQPEARAMNRFMPGNRLTLLRSGSEYFPALLAAVDHARSEIWLETYIYADDDIGRKVTDALIR